MTRQIPETLVAGDTFKVVFDATPYSSADNFGLTLKLNGPSGTPVQNSFNATANVTATKFDIRLAPSVTANLTAGLYVYAVVASDNTDAYTVESGNITVEARADLSISTDLRTHNQKVLDAVNAVIEGRATQDQQSYTIAGRTLVRTPLKDLLELKKHYESAVHTEQGKGQKKLYVRFN